MLDQLLDVARLTTGKIRSPSVPVDLAEAVRGRRGGDAAVKATSTSSRFWFAGPGLRPCWEIWPRLRRSSKTSRATPRSTRRTAAQIDLSWSRMASGLGLRVRDTASASTPTCFRMSFELFAQGPRTLDRPRAGLGLGLPVVKQVVEMHGGSVEPRAAGHGQGSASRSPFRACRAAIDAANGRTRRRHGPKRRQTSPVLIVDDEQDTGPCSRLAPGAGHETVAVPDGPAALEAARSFRPDVALVDLGLPKMNGYEIARRLREVEEG